MEGTPRGDSWHGLDFLSSIQGSTGRYPVIQTLFLASRVGATGLLSVELVSDDLSVQVGLVRGRIHSVEDVPGLLGALQPVPSDSMNLLRDVGGAVALGHPVDRVLGAAASALGLFLVRLPSGTIRFQSQWTPPPGGFPLPGSLPRLLAAGLREARSEEQIRTWWKGHMEAPIRLRVPEDSPEDRWGLDSITLRMLTRGPRASTPAVLLDIASGNDPVRRIEMMRCLDLLHAFGILHIDRQIIVQPPAARSARPAEARVEPVMRREVAHLSAPAAPKFSGPPDAAVEQLEKIRQQMEGAHPAEALGLTGKRKVSAEDCAVAFREVSKRVHPDLFAGNPAAKALAEQCFGLLNTAHEASQASSGVADINRFLEAKHLNVQYISEKEHVTARLSFRKAELAWRNREWVKASEGFEDACVRDPVTWPHLLYRIYSRYLAKKQGLSVTIQDLDALNPPRPQHQAEVLVVSGNILKLENQAEQAGARYRKALEIHPDNRDAQREIRLQDKRAADAAAEGWLGRLMNKNV